MFYSNYRNGLGQANRSFAAQVAESAAEGLFLYKCLYKSHHPDIILLDLGLPDKDGLEIIRELRENTDTSILVVSARGQEKDKIEALDLGANDYITKPFHVGELMARLRVIGRYLLKNHQTTVTTYTNGYLTVDFEKRKVLVDTQEVHLTPLEYRLLVLLIANRGKVLTHNYILRQIWGYESGDTKSVRVFKQICEEKLRETTRLRDSF